MIPGTELLHAAIADGRFGELKALDGPTLDRALLWEGYDLRLDSIAIDVMHGSLDTIVTALGRPHLDDRDRGDQESGGSAAEALLDYPGSLARCSASSLMPTPYGVQRDSRAVFTDAVLESSWTAGYDGRHTTELTEYTDQGSAPSSVRAEAYAAVIEHVIACREGSAANRLTPASILDTLESRSMFTTRSPPSGRPPANLHRRRTAPGLAASAPLHGSETAPSTQK